ncbi:hypothetical protein Btru_063613 [Bulinus truncatus]|nr:hypothetical protein Btru_063613 [Bulinus truncatus]
MQFINRTFGGHCCNCELTKLIEAVTGGDEDVLRTLIRDNGSLINKLDFCGWAPLMYAIDCNNSEFVKILCHSGASANIKCGLKCTPLMLASKKGYIDIVKFLVPITSNLNEADIRGKTALMHAADNGKLKVVAELINNGVDISMKDKEGLTAYMSAVSNRQAEIVEFFQQNDNSHSVKRDEKMWDRHRKKIEQSNLKEINKMQKRNHISTENLSKARCHKSGPREQKIQHNHLEPANIEDEIHHYQHGTCEGIGQIYNPAEVLLRTSGKRKSKNLEPEKTPQDKCLDDETDTPVLRKKSSDTCQFEMFNVRVSSSHVSLGVSSVKEEGFDPLDEQTCLQFLQPTQQNLQYIRCFGNYKQKFRNKHDFFTTTAATSSIRSEETYFNADDCQGVELRKKTSTQSLSNRNNYVCDLHNKSNNKLCAEVNKSQRFLIVNVSAHTVNIQSCENVASGDKSQIIINRGK